jgi:hypothetical protein
MSSDDILEYLYEIRTYVLEKVNNDEPDENSLTDEQVLDMLDELLDDME